MTTASPASKPIEVFCSYTHADENFLKDLDNHLSTLKHNGEISTWHDFDISAGSEWAPEIASHLKSARIILLLISSNFLASSYAYEIEMQGAMKRHEAREARVIPLILRPCDWKATPFGKLKALPKDGKAVTLWLNRDEAFTDIAEGIRKAINDLTGAKPDTQSAADNPTARVIKEEPHANPC